MLTPAMEKSFANGYVAAHRADIEAGLREAADLEAEAADFLASLPEDGSGRSALDLAFDYAPQDYGPADAGGDLARALAGDTPTFADRRLGATGDRLMQDAMAFKARLDEKAAPPEPDGP